jgi:Cd2+/Zn2+-exporting ATPase
MVHKHLAIKENEMAIDNPELALEITEQQNETGTRPKDVRVSIALMATLAGGMLLLNSAIAGLPLFYGENSQLPTLLAMMGALLLGLPVVVHALKSTFHGEMHMDELVALAIIAAFATEQYTTAGVVAFFMLCSELIETRTALGARASIESLIRLTPTRAQLVDQKGQETEVQVSSLRTGDVVRVRPGDNIPADGQVVNGLSAVNEATITVESLPVDKVPGMQVFAGTTNLNGVLDINVTKAGTDTTLGKVQSLIMEAEKTRIPIMRIIDRYVKWYTPTILMIAGIIVFFTNDINRAISALVVSCPCALILATPTAMVAALSAAARLGILIKNVANLEIAGRMTAVVFDKTGTVTTGRLYVTKLTPATGIDPANLLSVAASAEQMSKHPAARALLTVAKEANLLLPASAGFEEVPGKGVRATVDGTPIIVGREMFLKENQIDMASVAGPALHEEQGVSTLFVARGKQCIGWIGMQDKTRPEASRAISELIDIGIKRVTMLTGDRSEVAHRVAAELGCTDVKANCLPHDKLAIVEQLKGDGHNVAVVGDGINDAPALGAGDLGIAMGAAGSDVAINSASIALMSDDLRRLPFLIKLSRKTRNVINQNLCFGILFIVLGVSAAAVNWLPPIFAAMAHFGGSLIVVFNSARLVRYGEELEHVDM